MRPRVMFGSEMRLFFVGAAGVVAHAADDDAVSIAPYSYVAVGKTQRSRASIQDLKNGSAVERAGGASTEQSRAPVIIGADRRATPATITVPPRRRADSKQS